MEIEKKTRTTEAKSAKRRVVCVVNDEIEMRFFCLAKKAWFMVIPVLLSCGMLVENNGDWRFNVGVASCSSPHGSVNKGGWWGNDHGEALKHTDSESSEHPACFPRTARRHETRVVHLASHLPMY